MQPDQGPPLVDRSRRQRRKLGKRPSRKFTFDFEGETMIKHYSRKQAIELLGFTSTNAFLQLARKYPDVFANVNPHTDKNRQPWYDKAKVDQFIQMREHLKQEKQ